MNEDDYVEGEWYWVTTDGTYCWPAKRDSHAVGGWTNEDTWEDFDRKVTRTERIPFPSWLKRREGE